MTVTAIAETPSVPSLRRNVAWTFGGNVIYAGCQWLMLAGLTKMTSQASVGQFALALAISAPVVMLTNLQLRAVLASDANRRFDFATYWRLRLTGCGVALAVIASIALFGLRDADAVLVILAIGVAKCIEALSDVLYGILQSHEDMATIARSMVLRGLLALGAFLVTVQQTGRVFIGAVAIAAAWAAGLLLYDWPVTAHLRRVERTHGTSVSTPRSPTKNLAPLVRLSLPLGITMLLISLNTNIPRYFVEGAQGKAALGVYAALSSPTVAGLLIVTALGQSAMPRLARLSAANDHHAFRRLMLKLCCLGLGIATAGVAIAAFGGVILLRILFTPEYAAYAPIFVWLNVAAGVGYVASFLGYGLTALQRFDVQVPLMLVVVAVTTAGGWILIPRHGLLGATFALLAAAIVQLVASAGIVWTNSSPHRPARYAGQVR